MRAVIALLVGLTFAANAARPDPIARGRQIALQACAGCHGVERGDVSRAPRAPAFASTEMQHVAGLEGRVAALTRSGHYAMPPIELVPGEVEDLVAYIESLSAPPRDKRQAR